VLLALWLGFCRLALLRFQFNAALLSVQAVHLLGLLVAEGGVRVAVVGDVLGVLLLLN
jgi:hypothetical protein